MSDRRLPVQSPFALTLLLVSFIFIYAPVTAAPLYFEPVRKILPDGRALNLFVSGDEFFNWVHDSNGFPVGEGADGYYYFMVQEEDSFNLTSYRVDRTDPKYIPGIKTVTVPSYVTAKRQKWEKQIEELSLKKGISSHVKSSGTVNNLVIFLKFSGETEFVTPRSDYDTKMNYLNGSSMRNYFREISYNKLDVVSYLMPGGTTSSISYTDPNTRKYYQPYNASSNLIGYKDDTERGMREHTLLANAVNWVKNNFTMPEGDNFDYDDDGKIDNICFIARGVSDGWNDLLWPHRWVLYYANASIGGLGVWGYTFQLESVSVTTLSHEMFHALGAPDLYHYYNSVVPVGQWDIMANGKGHPGAWMKYFYGKWISSIPEISSSGTYTIKPLSRESNNCYLLRSPLASNQFFILEYRKAEGLYEINIPASGLIITRIDTRYRGNSGGPPDEIYVYRYNGTTQIPGTITQAPFSLTYGRGTFSDISNPSSFLQDGNPGGINIKDITSRGDSMTFTVSMDKPVDLQLVPVEDTSISLAWKFPWASNFIVAASETNEKIVPVTGKFYAAGDTIGKTGRVIYTGNQKSVSHNSLISDEEYFYSVWSLIRNNPPVYSEPAGSSARTGIYALTKYPYVQNFDDSYTLLPRGWKRSLSDLSPPFESSVSFSQPNSAIIQPAQTSDQWLYTPGFTLSTYQKYMITFRYRNIGSLKPDSLFIRGGYSREESAINQMQIFTAKNFKYNDFVLYKAVFMPVRAGVSYFGFRTGINGSGVLIDDVRLEAVPVKTKEHVNPAEFYPNPTSGKITVPATENTTITIFTTNGDKVFETVIESMQEMDLSFLSKGFYIIRFSTKSGSSSGRLVII